MKIEIGITLSDYVIVTTRSEIVSLFILAVTYISSIISILGIYENAMRVVERYIVLQKHK